MGHAAANMLLEGGARVGVTGRSKEGLESSQKELGNDAIVVSSDARSLTDLDALASRVKAEFDTIDLLFVNAGLLSRFQLIRVAELYYRLNWFELNQIAVFHHSTFIGHRVLGLGKSLRQGQARARHFLVLRLRMLLGSRHR